MKISGEPTALTIVGILNFLAVPKLTAALAKIPAGAKAQIELNADFMDHAAFEALHSWQQTHQRTGGTVEIIENQETWYSDAQSGSPRVTRN